MSTRKALVEKYIDGFRRTDHAQILSCLTDDVVWVIHGYKAIHGKKAFDAEIENEAFEARPSIDIECLVEEGDRVAITGTGTATKEDGEKMTFAFSEMFSFTGDLVNRIDTYHVWTK